MPSPPFLPIIVLHQPQLGENIGMSARAMANCGLKRLHLSSPREGWSIEKAKAASTCGAQIIEQCQSFDHLSSALSGCQRVYATSARRRDMPMRVVTPEQAAIEIHNLSHEQQAAFVFGGEASGLSNQDLALADTLIEIPLDDDCTSLNLSQAVLLCCYCLWQIKIQHDPNFTPPPSTLQPPAEHEQVQFFLRRLQIALKNKGFFTESDFEAIMWRNLQAMFYRAGFSYQEIQTWHGILSALIR